MALASGMHTRAKIREIRNKKRLLRRITSAKVLKDG